MENSVLGEFVGMAGGAERTGAGGSGLGSLGAGRQDAGCRVWEGLLQCPVET